MGCQSLRAETCVVEFEPVEDDASRPDVDLDSISLEPNMSDCDSEKDCTDVFCIDDGDTESGRWSNRRFAARGRYLVDESSSSKLRPRSPVSSIGSTATSTAIRRDFSYDRTLDSHSCGSCLVSSVVDSVSREPDNDSRTTRDGSRVCSDVLVECASNSSNTHTSSPYGESTTLWRPRRGKSKSFSLDATSSSTVLGGDFWWRRRKEHWPSRILKFRGADMCNAVTNKLAFSSIECPK
eukprot:GEMP01054704.1.p1 GENE.GEMP01054704.1~~GEMP01054704.1.p1  ORF type:complete len:238 (+),score=63.00 GEMP01054704.1:242-955(+)